jgi:hypothetical protein
MKLSWNNLKVSIAGAKLSHLAQTDRIWDHGSMIEQARAVFIHLKKAFLRNDPSIAEKCMTSEGHMKICKNKELRNEKTIMDSDLLSIEIISVIPSKHYQRDKFKALIKLKKEIQDETREGPVGFYKTNQWTEQEWLFVREGNWWLLHEIKK